VPHAGPLLRRAQARRGFGLGGGHTPDQRKAADHGVRALFFLVDVSSERLEGIAALIERGQLTTCVGDVLPLADARIAHEMLAGRPHKRGKIVLRVAES
jgi:NADPH:quinone reductase-like Zn-dependent oxidoreductase